MRYREGTGENGASVLTAQPIGRCSAAEATGVPRVSVDCAA